MTHEEETKNKGFIIMMKIVINVSGMEPLLVARRGAKGFTGVILFNSLTDP